MHDQNSPNHIECIDDSNIPENVGPKNTVKRSNSNSNDEILVTVFKHSLSGDRIDLTQDGTHEGKFKLFGFQNEGKYKYLNNANFEKLINDGILVKLGTRKYVRKWSRFGNQSSSKMVRTKQTARKSTGGKAPKFFMNAFWYMGHPHK